jgi:hypothetical protein
MDFEEGGNPVYGGRLYAARDPVLCDAWAAYQMGYSVEEIPYIRLAEKLGVGSADIKGAKIRELSEPNRAQSTPKPTGKARQLGGYIQEDQSCSACYAALVLALSRMSAGELGRLKDKVSIGQGFKGKGGRIGVGRCTSSFQASVGGCPPGAGDILSFLRKQI